MAIPRARALTGLFSFWEAPFSDKYLVLYWEYETTIEDLPGPGNRGSETLAIIRITRRVMRSF